MRWPLFVLSVARCTVLVRACERRGSGFSVGRIGGGWAISTAQGDQMKPGGAVQAGGSIR